MRPGTLVSTRGVALGAAFCALSIAAGCGRETFDLLQTAGAGSIPSAPTGSAASSGASTSDGGSGNGGRGELDASSGKAGLLGLGGHVNLPPEGGGSNAGPCIGEGGCEDGPSCAPSAPFCAPCHSDKDCTSQGLHCDSTLGVCTECRRNSDCSDNEACDLYTRRCAKACKATADCVDDNNHLVCETVLGVCVSCTANSHCQLYPGHSGDRCFKDTCVECYENWQCASQLCLDGRCQKPH